MLVQCRALHLGMVIPTRAPPPTFLNSDGILMDAEACTTRRAQRLGLDGDQPRTVVRG